MKSEESGNTKTGNGDNDKASVHGSEMLDSRRSFIKYFLFGSAVTWTMATFYGLARFFKPPKTHKRAQPKFVDIAKKSDNIEINSSLIFQYGDRPAILIRNKTGKFMAYFATCPHLECIVQYNPKSQMIVCPCHDGIFNLNGKNFAGPPTEPLEALVVQVNRKSKIRVSKPTIEET